MKTALFRARRFQMALSLALAWGLSARAGAAIWYVDDSAPGGGVGTSWTSPFNTLQAALTAAAASGDEIRLGRGTYKPAGPGGSRSATFTINKSVTIKGGYCGFNDPLGNDGNLPCGGPPSTILSGDLNGDDGANFANTGENSLRVVTIQTAVTVRLQNLQISGGNANSGSTTGGGLAVLPTAAVNATDVWFTDNQASAYGGAVDNFGTNNSIYAHCVFLRNRSVQYGGAVSLSSGSGARVANCRFHSNTLTGASNGTGGGALWINGPSTIVGCIFTGNSVSASTGLGGGAIAVGLSAGTSAIVNCSLASNAVTPFTLTAAQGVASYASSGFSITNCVFADGEYYQSQFEVQGNVNATYSYNSGETGTGNIEGYIDFVDLNGFDNTIGTFDDEMVLEASYFGGRGIDAANAAALPADFADLDNDGNTAEAWPAPLFGEFAADVRFAQHGLIPDGPVAGTPPLDMGAFERAGTFDVVGPIIHVDARASGDLSSFPAAGSTWNNAISKLANAVALANSHPSVVTEIRIAGGKYPADFFAFIDRPNLLVRGGYAGPSSSNPNFRDPNALPTVFDGDVQGNDPPVLTDPFSTLYDDNTRPQFTVFDPATNCTFDGLRFRNLGRGGVTFETGVALITFRDVDFRTSHLVAGGMLAYPGGNMRLFGCDFDNILFDYAGAVWVRSLATLTAVNCTVTNVRQTLESEIWPDAPGRVGGTVLFEGNASATFTNCLFNGCQSAHGAVVHANDVSSSMTFTNCTLVNNSARYSAGTIYQLGGVPQISNSILWGNTAPASPLMLYSGIPGSTTFSNSVIQGGVPLGTSIRSTDPLFADTNGADNIAGNSDDDFRLRGNSPAIDLGSVSLLPSDIADLDADFVTNETLPRDLDLLARDFDGDFSGFSSPDAGCYEFAATGVINLSTNTIWPSIVEAIANAGGGHTVISPSAQFTSEPYIDFAGKVITLAGYSGFTQPSGGRYTLTDGATLGRPTTTFGPSITLNGELRVPTNANAYVNAANLTNGSALNVFDNATLTAGVPGSISGAGNLRLYAGATLSTSGAISSTGVVNALPSSTLSTTGTLSFAGTTTLQSATVIAGGTASITAVTNWTGSTFTAPSLSIASSGRFTGSGSVYANTLNSGRIYTVGNTLFVGNLTNNVGGIITVQLGTATLIGSLTNNGTINGILSNPALPPPGSHDSTVAFYREFYGDSESARTAPGDGMFIRGDYVAGVGASLSLPDAVWRLTVAGNYDAAINSNANYDMRQAELVMARPDTGTTTIEAMSLDRGNVAAGLDRTLAGSFPIGTLRVGAGSSVGSVDARDNVGDGQANCEAVYCDRLIIESGAVLSAPSCRVYYRTLTNSGGTIANPANVIRIPPPCGGADFNSDGVVNTADLVFFLGRFGQPVTPGSLAERADFNADGVVNTVDLVFFLGRFGSVCPL